MQAPQDTTGRTKFELSSTNCASRPVVSMAAAHHRRLANHIQKHLV